MFDAEALVRRLVELTDRRSRALEAGDYEAAAAVGAERGRIIDALAALGGRSVLSPEAVRLIRQVIEADRAALAQVQAEMVRVREELKRVRQARADVRRRSGAFRRHSGPDHGGGFERQA